MTRAEKKTHIKEKNQYLHLYLYPPIIPARHALQGFRRVGWMKTGHRKEKKRRGRNFGRTTRTGAVKAMPGNQTAN